MVPLYAITVVLFSLDIRIYAFLTEWDVNSGTVARWASHEHLGLLGDSLLAGPDTTTLRNCLVPNAKAMDLLSRPGQSPRRVLEDLANQVGLSLEDGAPEVLSLLEWLRSGKAGPRPKALDFATWRVEKWTDPILKWNPDLSQPPHRGWTDDDGRIKAEIPAGAATLQWTIIRSDSDTAFEIQLIDDGSQQVVRKIGRTRRPKKSLRWTSIVTDAVRAELRELNPSGDVEGYALRLRVDVFQGKRWVQDLRSEPFFLDLPDAGDGVVTGSTPTVYHALYRYHAEQRASAPFVADRTGVRGLGVRVRFENPDGRSKETSLDVSALMADMEAYIVDRPEQLRSWCWRSKEGEWGVKPNHNVEIGSDSIPFLAARKEFFSSIRGTPVEAVDLLDHNHRELADRYVSEFLELASRLEEHAETGSLAEADRERCAVLSSLDAIEIPIRADSDDPASSVLLIAPTHPVVVAWLLGLGDLLKGWAAGRFDPAMKPPYRGVVEDLAVGPRSMVVAEPRPSSIRWWAFGGNLNGAWQCYLPIEGGGSLRATNWERPLLQLLGLSERPVGAGRLDASRIGGRLKKYAVLHPYVSQLRLAAVLPGDGREMLDALKVIDEQPNTPRGARSVREIRYQLSLIGPASTDLGSAIEDLVSNPGSERWRRHAAAILDNPETVLSPGFGYARRPLAIDPRAGSIWPALSEHFGRMEQEEGVHVLVLGPMLATTVGTAAAPNTVPSLELGGLVTRPLVRHIAAIHDSPFEGDWLLTIAAPTEHRATMLEKATGALADCLRLCLGAGGGRDVGLQVALSGAVSENLRKAHGVADWVVIADPLFSVELLDRPSQGGEQALLLDYTPEFEPYPGGRVVVTTTSLDEVNAIADPVGRSFSATGAMTRVLASISARLLLNLANPTKQVVHGLAGLALTRTYIEHRHPRGLVLPIDGHEDMFVIPNRGRTGQLADLLAVDVADRSVTLHVYESKWTGGANLKAQVEGGARQAATTAEVLRSEYVGYHGVDRELRLENLRDVIAFHIGRARRHKVAPSFDEEAIWAAFSDATKLSAASIDATVVTWCPDAGGSGAQASADDGVERVLFGQDSIEAYAAEMDLWPPDVVPVAQTPRADAVVALQDISNETSTDDLRQHMEHELATTDLTISGEVIITPTEMASGDGRGKSDSRLADVPPDDHPSAPDPCILLGSVLGSDRDATWCPPKLSNGHMILIGGSGAGKTTALRHISSELRQAAIPVLVLDFHGDLIDPLGTERVYTFDYEGNKDFVNPFHLDPSYGSRLTPSRLKWEFVEAFRTHYSSMGVHQINYLAELIEASFASNGISDDPRSWGRDISFGDVIEQFDASDAPDALKAKIRSYMKRFSEWRIFHGGAGIGVESFLRTSTRLDLSQLDEAARNILADVVLRRLFLIVRALGPVDPGAEGWAKFRAYVVIDEAQLLMGGVADAKASLTKYAAEARKFGIGMILATQLRDNVPSEIWGNIDTRLFMQALDPMERSRNAKAANVPEIVLQSLARGQAILTSSSQPNQRPATIQIRPSWIAP